MKISIILFLLIITANINAQDYGGDKVGIANFVRRMYNAQPFDGVKVLQTQDGKDYMISVVGLKKDPNRPANVESRIASVKAKAFACQYVNGSNVSTEVTIVTTEQKTKDSTVTKTEMKELLKETTIGFAEGMELLINFESNDGKQVLYVYYREIKK